MKTKIVILLLSIFTLSSCGDYLDINADPYLPQQGPPHLYIPQILYAMAEGPMADARFIGYYTQNWHLNTPNFNYDFHGSPKQILTTLGLNSNQTWRNHYWSIGSNLNQVELQAKQRGLAKYVGISKAIRAWSWLTATSQFGEMPFDEAWDNTKTKFKYNTQEQIFVGIEKLTDEAIAELSNPQGTEDTALPSGDLLYGGDAQKWIRFAYAVKARLAHRYSNKSNYNPAKVIEMADKAFANNTDNATIKFSSLATDISDRFSYMGITRANFNNARASKMIVELMNGTHFGGNIDPRIDLILTKSPDGQFRGVEVGKGIPATVTTAMAYPQLYGKYIFQNTAPYPLMTYAEMQFIKAEAAFKQNNRELARTSLINGIKAHGEQTGATVANMDAFIAKAIPAAAQLELKHIMSQKYIALYGNTHETWVDLRRYAYDPNVFMGYQMPNPFPANNQGKPVQRCHPTSFSEEDWNRENLEAVGGMALDYHTKPVWFSTKD